MIRLAVIFMLVCCFTLATILDAPVTRLRAKSETSEGVLTALMGDSRRLFANHFFAMADAYFHSGFYPTIFDTAKTEERTHISEVAHEQGQEHEEHEETFLGQPKDWIERFGRHFYPTVHTHLSGANVQEILPFLKLSAEMDPNRIDTYITTAYWLRTSLKRPEEAEQFLRQGLRANPDSYEIYLELGRVYFYNKREPSVGRNIFMLARDKWLKQQAAGDKPEAADYEEILGEIVRVDRQEGDLKAEVADLEELIKVSHSPQTLEAEIRELKARLARRNPGQRPGAERR
jgi:tetratricopeptide (TPR) repeat protein